MSSVAMIGAPSSAGARQTGQEQAPAAFRAAGLLERLQDVGLHVTDLGDLPVVPFAPDPDNPRQQNLSRVVETARRTGDRVDQAVASGHLPLVLGGDCSISLGVLAGLLRHHPRLGLLYCDGDVDLNTPATTRTGILDGMVIAHVLGRGAPELAGLGPRCPLLSEEDIVLFGYDETSGWIDPVEYEVLDQTRMARFSSGRVRSGAEAAARQALAYLEDRTDAVLVHFDVDVTNLQAADLPHRHGLDPATAFAALDIFVAAPSCAAMVVTEFNAARDRDGSDMQRVVDGLVHAFAASRE